MIRLLVVLLNVSLLLTDFVPTLPELLELIDKTDSHTIVFVPAMRIRT